MKICSYRIHFIKIFHIKIEMEVSWRIRLLALIPMFCLGGAFVSQWISRWH